jgi:hypothetical protein
MNRVEQMKAVQKEALELFTRKNADYGDAFAKYGVIGVLHLFTFQTPIIYDNSAWRAELFIYKGDLSVKSNSYLITFKDADPLGSAFEMLKGVMRIEDKLQRSMSITKNGVNLISDEGIRDTLTDLHNYAAMALMLLDE